MKRKISAKIRQRLKSRSAIEPVIGHLKADYRLDRNYLHGESGDRINSVMAGCAFNLRKLMAAFLFWFYSIIRMTTASAKSPITA